jgi:hypothetical protein
VHFRTLLRRLARHSSGGSATGSAGGLAGAVVLTIFGIGLPNGARAQIVTNGNFEVPSVASAPSGYLVGPAPGLNVSGAGWSFPALAGGYSGVTIVGAAGAFTAPNPSDSNQVGLVVNLGQIWQPIKLPPGGYTLSFKLAQRAAGNSPGLPKPIPLPISVRIGRQNLGTVSPLSTTSYNSVSLPFQIPTGVSDVYGLYFVGIGDPFNAGVDDHTTFIDAVSITAGPAPPPPPPPPPPSQASPAITSATPSDIDPTSALFVQGSNLWPPPVQVHVKFPNASEVKFSNGSDSEINLDVAVDHQDVKAVQTARIDEKYPYGKVGAQTVDIFVTADGGKLKSNVLHARFDDKAVITSGPTTITPGQKFILQGWDFDSRDQCSQNGQNRGTVTLHFPLKSAVPFMNPGAKPSDTDLVIPIPRDSGAIPSDAGSIPSHGDGCWPDAVKVMLPSDTQGVVRQKVDITYESPAGRKSNAWSAEFTPTLVTLVAPYYWVVASCAQESASDNCNNLRFGSCWDGPVPLWGLLGYWPPYLDSIIGDHHGCWGVSSDDGTDVYTLQLAAVGENGKRLIDPKDGWVVSGFGGWGVQSDNATAGNGLLTNGCPDGGYCVPANYVRATIPWHIGATGGDIDYYWDIHIQGPAGVPLPLPGAAYPPFD